MFIGLGSGLFKLYDKCICCVKWYKTLLEPVTIYAGSEEYPLPEILNKLLNKGKKHREGMKKK